MFFHPSRLILPLLLGLLSAPLAAQVLFQDDFEACCGLDASKWQSTTGWSREYDTGCSGSYVAENTSSLSSNGLQTIDIAIPAAGATLDYSYASYSLTTYVEVYAGGWSLLDTAGPTSGICTARPAVDLLTYAGQTVSIRWRKEAGSPFYAKIDDVVLTGNGPPCPNGSIFADDFESGSLDPGLWPTSSGVFVWDYGTCSASEMALLASGDTMQTRDLDLSCATRAQTTFTFSFDGLGIPPRIHLHYDGGAGNPEVDDLWVGYDTGGACETVTVDFTDYIGSASTRLEFEQTGSTTAYFDDVDISAWSNTGWTENFDASTSLPAGWTPSGTVIVSPNGSAHSPGNEAEIDSSSSLASPSYDTSGASAFLVKLRLRCSDSMSSEVQIQFRDSGGTYRTIRSVPANELASGHRYFRWSVTPDGYASGNVADLYDFFHPTFAIRVETGFLLNEPVRLDTVVLTTAPHVRTGFSWHDVPQYGQDGAEDGRGCAVFAPGTVLPETGKPAWGAALADDFCYTDYDPGSPAVLFGVVGHADFSRYAGGLSRYVADYTDSGSPGPPPNATLDTVSLSRDHRHPGPGYLLYDIAYIDHDPVLDIHPRTGEAMGYSVEGSGDTGLAFDEAWWLSRQPAGCASCPVRTYHQDTIEDEFGYAFPDYDDLLFEPDNTCGSPLAPPMPVSDGGFDVAGTAMRTARNGTSVDLDWDVSTCTASADYNVYIGILGSFDAAVESVCGVGASGSATVPIAEDRWWVMTGSDGAGGGAVASLGHDSDHEERVPSGWDGLCPQSTLDLTTGCP